MNGSSLGLTPQSINPASANQPQKRRKKPWLAILLSLLSPGLAQVYNGQLLKGFTFVLTGWTLLYLGFSYLMASPYGLIAFLILLVTFHICLAVDAYRIARRWRFDKDRSEPLLVLRIGAAILIVSFNLVVTSDSFAKKFYSLHAFKVPSGSMCPTVCDGDRVIANLRSFREGSPHRGDVILFLYDKESSLHVKRVAALGGDEVAVSNGRLLVNGKLVKAPTSACGSSIAQSGDYGIPQEFVPMRVPQNSLFLLGDNAENSFDSRFYGAVETGRVRGRLLYLYWSPEHGRIGCPIK
jgi:signal peptidase I